MDKESLKKGDSEYVSNGHYQIDGNHFMSVWAFKNRHGIEPNNHRINGYESAELSFRGVGFYESIPDFGNFSTVRVFSIDALQEYYKI